MQVKTTARRLLQAGLLNPTAPASRRPEGSASRAASSGCSDRVEISREGRTAALSGAGTPEPPAEKPNQPDGFDFTGVDWEKATAVFADYSFKGTESVFGTSLSGIIGSLAVLIICLAVCLTFRYFRKKKKTI